VRGEGDYRGREEKIRKDKEKDKRKDKRNIHSFLQSFLQKSPSDRASPTKLLIF
jgi:hypothetical protein